MNERPSGTVTFLFTDIEGSTRLWEHHHRAMKSALSLHDDLVRSTIESHGGYVFSTGGDSFSAAFSDPIDAAVAALDIHRALDEHDWDEIGELRVRTAIDTGLADERDGDYFGPPLNRAARILGRAGGGETLCSHTTADLLRHDLPGGYSVVKIGRRKLRGVEDAETLYRIAETPEAPLRSRRMTTAAIVAGLAVIGLGWWATGSTVGDESDGAGSGTTVVDTATTAGVQDDSGVLWSQSVGDIVAGPLILGDVVVTATEQVVSAFDLGGGDLLWDHDGFERISRLDTDGRYLFVASAERLDVLHPRTGDLVPRCGFSLPVTFARTNVVEDDVFIMVGSLYRVATHPGEEPCHGPVVENAGTMSGLDPTSGPVHTGRVVVAADAVGVYAFDPLTLDLQWRYPDRSEPAISVHPPSLVAADLEQRIRTTSTSSTIVALTDDAGILHVLVASETGVRPMPPPVIRTNRDRPIVITEHAVVAVNAQNRLIGTDPETGEIKWTVDDVDVTAGPLEADAWILIATTDRLLAIDPIDGSTVKSADSPGESIRLAMSGHVAVVVGSDQTMSGLPLPWAEPAANWRSPPDPSPSPEPEVLVRRFIDAWNRGDRQGVERLIGVDISFLATGLREIWSTKARAMLWTWFDGDQVLESEWSLSSCATETVGLDTFAVTCTSTYADVVSRTAGVDLEEFATRVTVRNGVIIKVIAGGNTSRPGEGGVFTDFGGRWVLHDRFDDWAAEAHAAEHAAACQTVDGMGPQCAAFTVAHVDEWAETLGS